MMILLLMTLMACSEQKGLSGDLLNPVMSDYHGMVEDASWIYLDTEVAVDSGEILPSENALLRVRHTGDGMMEFRRGDRWADAQDIGYMAWNKTDGLKLKGFQLPFGSNTETWPMATEQLQSPGKASQGAWTCLSTRLDSFETWYAVFTDVFQFSCSGGGGPEGVYSFARGIGLVQLETSDYSLDLVAPW